MVENSINAVKEFWDTRPCNIRHSRSEFGTKQYFDEVEQRKYFVEPHIPIFAEFEKWNGKKVLEIGCGIGTDAVNFVRAGAKYTAIELSEKSIDIAKHRFSVFGLKGTFYLGSAEELTNIVPVESYDLIYSFGVIHHTPNPQNVANQVVNYMSRDSEFRLMLYAKNSWKSYMIEAGIDQPEAQSGCPIAYTYDFNDIQNLLRNYDVFNIRQDHIFPYIIDKYVNYKYEVHPWFKCMPKEIFDVLRSKLGWHNLIKCRTK